MTNLLAFSVLFLASAFAFGQGASAGSGDNPPQLAYTPEQLEKIKSGFTDDYKNLTLEDVTLRDKKLKPILDFYNSQTVGKLVSAISGTWGTHVYHHVSDYRGTKDTFSNKHALMSEIVKYYTSPNNGNESSFFSSAPEGEIAYRNVIQAEYRSVNFKKLSGKYQQSGQVSTPYLLRSERGQGTNYHTMLFWDYDTKYNYATTTTNNPLFEAPSVDEFFQAMMESKLKALDATVVFLSGSIRLSSGNEAPQIVVIYPQSSPRVPIPNPVIFIGAKAKKDEILAMLQTHAPLIYTYNKLFNEKKLPTINEINSILSKYPKLLPEVASMKSEAARAQMRSALMAGFLKVNYSILTAGAVAATLPFIAASVVLSPLIAPAVVVVSTTVVIF